VGEGWVAGGGSGVGQRDIWEGKSKLNTIRLKRRLSKKKEPKGQTTGNLKNIADC